MQTYRHWQDIAFLPVINSLVEEHLQQLDSVKNSMTNHIRHRNRQWEHSLDINQIEGWHQLYIIWKQSPHKTIRQEEWLNALNHSIDHLKNSIVHC